MIGKQGPQLALAYQALKARMVEGVLSKAQAEGIWRRMVAQAHEENEKAGPV